MAKPELRRKVKEFLKKEKDIQSSVKRPKILGARERIRLLLDKGTFVETDIFVKSRNPDMEGLKGDGVVTGYGKIDGRQIFVFSQDSSQKGGTLGEMHAKKIAKIMELAMKTGCPIIGIEDSGGARIQEGIRALDGYADIFYRNTQASGVVPQISIVLGSCAGGAVYSPALTDFIFTVKGMSKMFITGPKVIKSIMSEEITPDKLGGAEIHAELSGVAHFQDSSEQAALLRARKLLSYLPSNNLAEPPTAKRRDRAERMNKRLLKTVPSDPTKSYDMTDVITDVFDKGSILEIQEDFAKNIIVGLARLNGKAVGIVANQPCVMAGCLDINSSEKATRFVRFCDSFNIPIINLVDVPGYLPGKEQEYNGIIRHGAGLLYAYAEATVPKISLVLRKAYGGAYIVLCSRAMHYDQVLAWPTARIAVMGSRQAADIIYKDSPDKESKAQEYSDKYLNPYVAAKNGSIDRIIDPSATRIELGRALDAISTKRERRIPKKHGNIPL